MKTNWFKRTLCSILALVLVLGYVPVYAIAAESDGLCEHHTQHTEACGYSAAVEGHACNHEHTDECYQSVAECVHTHGDCGYVPAVEGHDCDCQPDENGEIIHQEGCGYQAAVAGVPCDHVCSEDSGCIHSVLDCRHVHDGDCGYAEAKAETPCTYDCAECATEETSVVGGTASEGEADADQEAADPVAAQIAALPTPEEIRVMSAEERSDAYEQVQSAYNAYNALTGTQKALIPNAESTFASLFACFDALAEPNYTVLGSGTCGENLTWELTDDGTLTISGTGAMDDYTRYRYAPWYAYRSQIDSVMIGEGVTSIGAYAFCSYTGLTSVIIPAGVTSIGEEAFRGCSSLTSVIIPEGVTSIEDYAFSSCASLTSVIIPGSVTSFERCAFIGCTGLTSVTIQEGVTSIGYFAFENCTNLTSVTIPDSVTSVRTDAFSGCTSLTKVTYAGTMQQWQGIGYRYPAVCSDGTIWAWGSCGAQGDNLTWTLTNDWVLTISGTGEMKSFVSTNAPWYSYREKITDISMEEGITTIGADAFCDCTGLTAVTIPESVTGIWSGAFYGCTGLTKVTIPAGVTSIVQGAFSGCTSLTKVTYAGTMQQWQAMDCRTPAECNDGTIWAWGGVGEYTNQTYTLIDDGLLTIQGSGNMEFNYNGALIPWYEFRDQITSVILADGITSIDGKAFKDCVNLTSVTIPESITFIRSSAFYGCTSLASLSIPVGITYIFDSAFANCPALREITFAQPFGSNLTIESSAFSLDAAVSANITIRVPTRMNINDAIADYDWAGTGRTVTYVSTGTELAIGTGGPYRSEVAVGETIPMLAESCNESVSVSWSVENGTGTASIDQFGNLTGLTVGTVMVYAEDADGNEVSCTVNVVRYVDSVTVLLNGRQDIRRLGIGEKLQLSAMLTPTDTTTSGVTWSVEDGTGSATVSTSRYEYSPAELTGVTAGTVTLIATAKDSRKTEARLELTVTDTVRSYAVTGGNLYYNTETGIITGSDRTVTNVVIPAVIDGVTITGIAPYAFANRESSQPVYRNEKLASVSIPKTVTEIGDHAFDACVNLSSLRIASGSSLTTIGEYAFQDCDTLQTLVIPDGVTTIGKCAFYGCDSVKHLTMSGELDSSDWLRNWIPLESITFTGKRIVGQPHWIEDNDREGFEHFGSNVFCRNAKKIIISDSVEVIEPHAFCLCRDLTEVTGCANVTSIGEFAFFNCSNLSHVELGQKLTTIERQAFLQCDSLTEVTLPEGIKSLGFACFAWCGKLVSINLPATLENIGEACFMESPKMQIIDMSNVPDQLVEYRTLISGKAGLPNVLVKATNGKAQQGWGMRSLNNDGEDPSHYAHWYRDSGKLYLEVISAGKFVLETFDSYTGARGSKVVEVKAGTVIRPAEPEYLVSGQKLQLSAWQMPSNTKTTVKWSLGDGDEQYASLSSAGLLTAKSDSQAYQITITATPLNGDNSVTRTIWILPKTTGIQLKLGDSNLRDTLNVDMYADRTLTLSAQSYPEGALNEVSWTSSNTRIATVHKQTGQVTLLTPGMVTITATATDGSGVKASVKLNVIYLDAAKTLKAFAEVPPIGLQPGQTTAITVSGENLIAPEELIFTTSNASIATVDEQGVLAAGTKPGTVTITAALKGDPLKRKATVKVPVIAMQAEELSVAVDGAVKPELRLDKDSALRTFTLTAPGKNYLNDDFTPNITWVSMDPAVASVTVARDGTVTLTIPANASGECFVTATSKDLAKITARLKVTVRDYAPRLNSTKLTLNSNLAAGTSVGLLESYDNLIRGVTLHEYNRAIKGYQEEPSTRFLPEYDSESATLTIRTLSPVANNTYSLQLKVATDYGEYTYNLQVKVANALPSVTVKQSSKFNLFYLDSTAALSITAPGQTITDVQLTGNTNFEIATGYTDGVMTIGYSDAFQASPAAKPNTKMKVAVYLQGYTVPVYKDVTLSTVNARPKLSLSATSCTINTMWGDGPEATVQVLKNGEPMDLTNAEVTCTAKRITCAKNGTYLTLTLAQDPDGRWVRDSVLIRIRESGSDGWNDSISLTYTMNVNSTLPAVKLGKGTLKLNNKFPDILDATTVALTQQNLAVGIAKMEIVPAYKKTQSAYQQAEKLQLNYDPETCEIHAQIVGDNMPNPGTYSFKCTGILGNEDSTRISPVTLKVQVINTMPTMKLAATTLKLNRFFTARTDKADVSLTLPSDTLAGVTFVSKAKVGTTTRTEAEKIVLSYNAEKKQINAKFLDPNNAPKAGTYAFTYTGTLTDGRPIAGGTLNVVVQTTVPVVRLSATSVKLNSYLAGAECVQITPTVGAGYTIIGFTETSDWVEYNTASGKLDVKLTPGAVNGKYTIKLTPILRDAATGQEVNHPTQLSLTVQVYNSEKLGVSLSARGKLDTLNPDSTIVYTPKLTNCIGEITDVSLAGQDAGKFLARLEDGKIVLALRDGQDYATNVTYKVQFLVSVCGKEILSPVMNVKVTQSAAKRTVTPGSLTLYQAQRMPLTLRLTQSMGEIDDISISTKTSSELIKALGGDGINATIEGNTAGLKLTVENAALLKAGKSYTLYLDVTPKNNATNLNPAQVKLTVRVMK